MFKKLRDRIIIITMAVTTVVLVLSGALIMLFSSATRPEPPRFELEINLSNPAPYNDQELRNFIKKDRKEGSERLLITLLCVGATIEIAVFLSVYYASQKIVEPVKDSYDKQKIFIANASHELKTPLAVIEANMEALDVDQQNQKWKQNIVCEIDHANKLVLDLLQLARMDAGTIEQKAPEKVDLPKEIKKRIEMFSPKFSGDISFKTTSEPNRKRDDSSRSTDNARTLILPKQDLLQILDILLDNATKYGEKKISVTLKGNNITISNDGAKISKADQEKVFDRFYQTDKTRNGSGLGLAIAKALCEQNGWQIVCTSGKNTTKFTVSF